MSDSRTKLALATRPQLPTFPVTPVAEPANPAEVRGVKEVQAAAKPHVRQLRHAIKRIEQPTAGELPVNKTVTRHPIRRPKLETAAAEQLAATFIGLQDVTTRCCHIGPYGAFFEVTQGPAKGFSGLLHVNNMPGGKTALEAIKVGEIRTLDITDAHVKFKGKHNKQVVRLAFDDFGKELRAAETRRAVFARGDVPKAG
jgi:hypothetical protein